MNKLLPLFVLFLTATLTIVAQTGDIKVLLSKGKVELLAAGTKNKPVALNAPGTVIHKGDTIRLADKAELVLTSGNKALVVKEAGKYDSEQLTKMVAKDASSQLLSKFLTYVAGEMKPEKENYEEYAKSHMKEKGSVTRGPNCLAPLMLLPARSSVLMPTTLSFIWASGGNHHFTFSIFAQPEGGAPIVKKDVQDTILYMPFEGSSLKVGKTYYWQAAEKLSPECPRYAFTVIGNDSSKALAMQLKEVQDSMETGSDIAYLANASIYEQHKLYFEANKCYNHILNDDSSREDVKQLYTAYLVRIGIPLETARAMAYKRRG